MKFKDFFDKHRIYFSEETCSLVDKLADSLIDAYIPLGMIVEGSQRESHEDWLNGAKIIQKELVKKNKKALIYAGAHHAFTHYNIPNYDFEKKKLLGHEKNRMGNLIYQTIPKKVFNICLHYPWQTQKKDGEFVYPVDGIIDQIMGEFEDKRIGFDVKNSPFGLLKDNKEPEHGQVPRVVFVLR